MVKLQGFRGQGFLLYAFGVLGSRARFWGCRVGCYKPGRLRRNNLDYVLQLRGALDLCPRLHAHRHATIPETPISLNESRNRP